MKTWAFAIFLTVFLAIYGAGNFYVFTRGYASLPDITAVKRTYTALFIFLALSFIIAEIGEKSGITCGNRFLTMTGSLWLAFLLYALIFIAVIDLVRAANHFMHFLPPAETMKAEMVPLKLMALVTAASLLVVTAGAAIASRPVTKVADIFIDKKKQGDPYINIAVISDIHLGNIVGKERFKKLAETINALDPDIVLFPGDFFDENLKPIIRDNMGGLIESIKPRFGVFAVTGNHEYIGGVDEAVEYMKKHGIRVLRDEAVQVDGLTLIGREDRSVYRFTGRKRRDLGELVQGTDHSLPLIVMDHQPFSIKESAGCGADLHISGHTHNGQLWPVNYITDMLYDVSHGYAVVNRTQVYVSCGYGTWGPPVRTSGRPELVVFQVRFRQ